MIVYILSGSNQTGKDTFVEVFDKIWTAVFNNMGMVDKNGDRINSETFLVQHISTIDPIRELFELGGIDNPIKPYLMDDINKKTEVYRSLLADIKVAVDNAYRCEHRICLTTKYVLDAIETFSKDTMNGVCFVDCREPEKIKELKENLCITGYHTEVIKTVRSSVRAADNKSDAAAYENNECDYIIDNDAHVMKNVIDFIQMRTLPTFAKMNDINLKPEELYSIAYR